MKNNILVGTIGLVMALILLSCKPEPDITPELGAPVDLVIGEQIILPAHDGQQLEIAFDSLLENSLCPEDAVCIWAGRAVVKLTVDQQEVVLGIGDLETGVEEPYVSVDSVGQYRIQLHYFEEKEVNSISNKTEPMITIQVD